MTGSQPSSVASWKAAVRISENLLVQYVEDEGLVVMDESAGLESAPIPDILDFTRKVHEERARGVAAIDVDGITIGSQAFDHLMIALGYFAGVIPHPNDARQFTASDYE
jgi:hypothetical protein